MAVPIELGKDVGTRISNGHTVVGTTAVQLMPDSILTLKGAVLRCPGASDASPNTDTIWLGGASVTADNDPKTGGMPILPGQAITIPILDPSELWLVSDAAAQDIAWILIS